MNKLCGLLVQLMIACVALVAGAQTDSVHVSLITFYPGSELFEVYGHSELRVRTTDSDLFFNYGVFDFHSPNFVYRFAAGETDYKCVALPGFYALAGYNGRKMVEQELNLTQKQAVAVRDMLIENAMPEKATYRYKYFSDNCATRPRDIIEKTVGESLRYPAMTDTLTFRQMLTRYDKNYAWERFGIDLALGGAVDTIVTYRQQMFIPMVLMKTMGGATIERDGKRVPLVKTERVLMPGDNNGTILPPTPWWQTPLAVAWLLLVVALGVTVADQRRGKVTRWFDTVLALAYTAGGCLMFFLVFVSSHEGITPNANALWLHPLHIVPAVLLWFPKAGKALRIVGWCNVAAMVLALVTVGLVQSANAAVYPLILVPLARNLNYLLINKKCAARNK